jgi:hypothetical protein
VYEALKRIAQNQTMPSQTKACITKLLCEICALVGYYAEQSDISLSMFQNILSAPTSKVKISKSQNRARLKITDNLFLYFFEGGLYPPYIFLKKHSGSKQKPGLFPFSGKETPNLVYF